LNTARISVTEAKRSGQVRTLLRHLAVIGVMILLVLLFRWRRDINGVHLWNRAFADASVVLLSITLIIGPVVRLVPGVGPLLPWRREFGIWCTLAAVMHVAIYASSFKFDLKRFFGGSLGQTFHWLDNPWAIGNWIGTVALVYAVVIAATSNDVFERYLGRGWKHLQQQSYTLFILTAIHTAIFLYAAATFGKGIFTAFFWIALVLVPGIQFAGYVATVRRHRLRRRASLKTVRPALTP